MSTLALEGARLHFRTHGSGRVLLMIPGANGSADGFGAVEEYLARHYVVVTYDRRGFSRSKLNGPQDYEDRLRTDAEDAWHLLEHLSPEPAIVFGSSSGAIVALELLSRYPHVVDTLVPFEPPAVKQLADGSQWLDFFLDVFELYRQSGMAPALQRFREHAFAESDRRIIGRRPANSDADAQVAANAAHWFEHELRQYPAVDLDIDVLRAHANQIMFAVGRESRGYPSHEVNVVLANKLGSTVVELPGGHLGFASQPAEFAGELMAALARRKPAAKVPGSR